MSKKSKIQHCLDLALECINKKDYESARQAIVVAMAVNVGRFD